MKRILSLVLVILTVSCLCIPIFAYDYYVDLEKPLDSTTVEADMENAGFDFDRWVYNGNLDTSVEILFTREYGYTKDGAALLYLYVYIDPTIYDLLPYAVHDTVEITLATKFDADGKPIRYDVKDGYCVDYSDDKRFYKYRIHGLGGFEWENGRLYNIGDIGVYQRGDEQTMFETRMNSVVNRGFYYTGYDDMNTVGCEVFQDSFIDLETTSTVYRTLSSDKGLGYSYDIFSVYFSVPNVYFEKYDYLREISYKYYEQAWNAVVVDNYTDVLGIYKDIYSQVNSMVGVDFSSGFNNKYASIYANLYSTGSNHDGDKAYRCDYSINDGGISPHAVYEDKAAVNMLLNAFLVDDWTDDDIFIGPNDAKKYFDYTESGKKSEWFYGSKTNEDIFNVESFSGNDPDIITKFYAWLYGYNKGYETQLSGVIPIVTFKDSTAFEGYIEGTNDEEYANEHLVNKRDIADFVNTVKTSTANNETVVLFRFAVRDYYSRNCVVYERDAVELADENGFYCQGTAFNDFNIISLIFRKSNQDFIVYVNNDPIDIDGGITGPNDTIGDDINESINGALNGALGGIGDIVNYFKFEKDGLLQTLRLILGAIVIVLVVFILSKPISLLFRKRRRKNEDDN